jgi:hypothetical protein
MGWIWKVRWVGKSTKQAVEEEGRTRDRKKRVVPPDEEVPPIVALDVSNSVSLIT